MDMKFGKNFKVLGVRQSLIGDCICAIPILNWIELKYSNSYKYWHLSRKCAQAAPIFFGIDLIDKIIITDCDEGFGPKDVELAKTCDLVFNTMPPHPFGELWHNDRTIYEETWVQAGLPLFEYHNLLKDLQKPKLHKWFNINKLDKTVILHCYAGYGFDNHRSFGQEYSEQLILNLIKLGYNVIRLGHPREPIFFNDIGFGNKYKDLRHLSFIEQIQLTLGGSVYIGSDSGFSLCIAAYDEIPQINLVCMWNVGHTKNPLCLAPNNDKSINLWDKEKCSNISQDLVLEKIKLF